MLVEFECSERWKGSVEVLQNSIFHIRITPAERSTQYSALTRYGYLEKLSPEENVSVAQTEAFVELHAAGGSLKVRKSDGCFTLSDPAGK
ncbi:MAG: hypothetical protein J6S58_09380, partial [Lentisphaeria bacterium]|nr:hypothetical protein [Lentisphaeria bacterium]